MFSFTKVDDDTNASVILALAVVSGALLVISVFHTLLVVFDGKIVAGKVVELKHENHVFRPVIEFSDEALVTRTFDSVIAGDPPPYALGEEVEVIYSSRSPATARINSFLHIWAYPLISGIGTILLVFGFMYYGKRSRGRQRSTSGSLQRDDEMLK